MSTIPMNTRHDDWCRGVADYWCWLIPCFINCLIGQWSMNQQPATRCSSQFPPRPTIHKMKSQAGVGQRMPTNPHVLWWFYWKLFPNIVLMNVSNMTYIYIIIIIIPMMVSYVIIISDLGVVIYTICPDPLVSHTAVVICSSNIWKLLQTSTLAAIIFLVIACFEFQYFLGLFAVSKWRFFFRDLDDLAWVERKKQWFASPYTSCWPRSHSPLGLTSQFFVAHGINHDKPLSACYTYSIITG